MMGHYGAGFGLMGLWGLLLLVGIAVLVLLAVRIFAGGASPGPGGKSQARLILDERFARGELTAEQYRENLKVLGEAS